MKKSLLLLIFTAFTVLLFACSDGNISSNDSFPLAKADEALSWAKQNGVAVCEDGKCTFGLDIFEKFFEDTENGMPGSVSCAHYYTLKKESVSEELYNAEKDTYPRLFFVNLEYDGESFILTSRKSDLAETDYSGSFKYLRHFTGDAPETAAYSTYNYYILVDDPEVTWEDILKGLVSSQSDAGYRHYSVLIDRE